METQEMKIEKMPALRFPEFEGEWQKKKLGVYTKSSSFGPRFSSDLYSKSGNVITLRTTDMDEDGVINYDRAPIAMVNINQLKEHILCENDLVISRSGTIGVTGIFEGHKMPVIPGAFLIRFRLKTEMLSPKFIQLLLNSKSGRNQLESLSAGGVQKNLTGTSVLKMEINLPPLPEQQKIADFLTAVDDKLQALKKKKSLLEQYKKGVMQKLFSQELRFKDEQGNEFPEWEERTLGEVAERVTDKNKENNLNVLTISAQHGLISQLEYFNKSVSSKDLTGYYLLHQDDFAYNKSYSNGYPMGAIKRLNRYEKGVVSTLYICFRFKEDIHLGFMEQYFETGLHNTEIEKVAQEGARNHGLLNIGVKDFFGINLFLPSFSEQTKIANFLSSLDEKIAHCQTQIGKTELYKKGLLQQMFV